MRTAKTACLRWILIVVALAAIGIAGQSVRGGGDGSMPRRGEIIIKPTGRKVRVVSVAPATPVIASQTQARVQPASLVVTTVTTTPAVASAPSDEGLEYGEHSVRLPLGYNPRDNFGYGAGPFLNYPIDCGYSVTPCYNNPGYAYGGFGGWRHHSYARSFSPFACAR